MLLREPTDKEQSSNFSAYKQKNSQTDFLKVEFEVLLYGEPNLTSPALHKEFTIILILFKPKQAVKYCVRAKAHTLKVQLTNHKR